MNLKGIASTYALEVGQPVTIITERAVFAWTEQDLVLVEIAPGADLERDILAKMEFLPVIAPELRKMPAEIFRDGLLNLAHRLAER